MTRRITKVIIDEEFIKYRNEHADEFGDYGRKEEEKIKDSDGLLPEYLMLKKKGVTPPYNKLHDWIFNGLKIDNKMINQDSNTVTIKNQNVAWMRRGVVNGHLTHFSITKWITPHTRALQVGDVVEFEWYKMIEARKALSNDNLRSSHLYKNSSYFFVD